MDHGKNALSLTDDQCRLIVDRWYFGIFPHPDQSVSLEFPLTKPLEDLHFWLAVFQNQSPILGATENSCSSRKRTFFLYFHDFFSNSYLFTFLWVFSAPFCSKYSILTVL